MENKDHIAELFKAKFENFEVPVSPEMWSAVSSSLATTTITKSGLSLFSKSLIGFSAAAVIGVTAYFVVTNDQPIDKKQMNQSISSVEPSKDNTVNSQNSNDNSVLERKNTRANDVLSGVAYNEDIPSLILPNDIIDTEEEVIVPVFQPIDVTNNQPSASSYSRNTEKEVSSQKPNDEHNSSGDIETNVEDNQLWNKLPNTFSPNADGINDLFFIEENKVSDFSITILDAKNNIVFKTDDVNFKWDGRDTNGNLVEAGTYIYYVMGTDSSNKKIAKTSFLTINK